MKNCQNAFDIFTADGLETIFQASQKYLEASGITTVELTYLPIWYDRIHDDGTRFQEVTQHVAILQGAVSRKSVAERLRDVLALYDEGAALIQNVTTALAGKIPEAKAETLDALAQSDPQRGPLLAQIAFAHALQRLEGWGPRFAATLDLLASSKNRQVLTAMDQTLGEMLRMKPSVDAIFGAECDNQTLLRGLMAILGDEAALGQIPERSPIKGIATILSQRKPPRTLQATRARLKDVLANARALAFDDPLKEWAAIEKMKIWLLGREDFAQDAEARGQIMRRMNALASPDRLNALLAPEPALGRRMILLLRLHADIDNVDARNALLAAFKHYLDLPDFKRDFAAGQPAEAPAILNHLVKTLSQAQDIADFRRERFLEVLRQKLGVAQAGASQRKNDRSAAGPEDYVASGTNRFKLRNWSPVGLLFGPYPEWVNPGDKIVLTVLIRNPFLTLNFEVDAVVVRVADEMVAVRYAFKDKVAEQKVKQFFA